MLNPAVGALSVLWLIAAYAIVFGVLLTVLGIEVHHMGKKLRAT